MVIDSLILFFIAAYVAGVPTAWAFGEYLLSVEKRLPFKAAIWDIIILSLSTLVTLTLWSASGDSPVVFIGYVLGNATGTYLIVKRAKSREWKS